LHVVTSLLYNHVFGGNKNRTCAAWPAILGYEANCELAENLFLVNYQHPSYISPMHEITMDLYKI